MTDIRFYGYCTDETLQAAYKGRSNPIELNEFFYAINNCDGAECSCCNQEVRVYAVNSWCTEINEEMLSLCVECVRRLPVELELVNLTANGVPVAIRHT